MSNISSRPCLDAQDQEHVVGLLLAYRAATSVYTYPTAWRLRLLLSSRVWEPAHDARVWQNAAGQLVGFAMLWRRHPGSAYLVLDRIVHPAFATGELVDALLAWGTQRAQAIAAGRETPLTLYTGRLHPAVHPDNHLESYGFTPTVPDKQVYNVYFTRSLPADFPEPALPARYTTRPLQSAAELEAYHALYDFAAVNPQHRQELLASDEYCHLVLVDPAGEFVAYCEYSICRAEWQQSGQRIGWIDYIGTHPEKRQQGLGRAILLASLYHLRAWGAETVMLVTINTNTPAVRLYQATGFTSIPVPEAPTCEQILP